MELVERLMGITDNFVGFWCEKNIFNNLIV